MRASVGSDTPMRLAHARMDSLRRLRATARLAPHSRSRVRTAGGISASALDCVDTTQMFAKSLLSKAFYVFDPDKRDTRLEPGTGQGPMPVNIFCRAGKRSRETRAKHGHDPCHCRLDEACRADLAQVKLWGVALARRRSTGSRPIGLRWPSVGHQLASGRGSVDDAASRRAVHQKEAFVISDPPFCGRCAPATAEDGALCPDRAGVVSDWSNERHLECVLPRPAASRRPINRSCLPRDRQRVAPQRSFTPSSRSPPGVFNR